MRNFRQALLHLVTSVLVADFDFFRFSANENVDKREKNFHDAELDSLNKSYSADT